MTTLLATFPRGAGTEVRVTLDEYKGVTRVDCRIYYCKADGTIGPTQKGVAFRLEEMPELLDVLGSIEVKP